MAPRGLDHVHFGMSGADAVETALKLARLNGKRRIVAMQNGYHGMTLGALSVTGFDKFRQPFEPLLPGVQFVPFGDAAADRRARRAAGGGRRRLRDSRAGAGRSRRDRAARICYLRAVEEACRAHNAFLVIDEVQTGLGRLGTLWGVDAEGVTPDVLLVGKALSGGVVRSAPRSAPPAPSSG